MRGAARILRRYTLLAVAGAGAFIVASWIANNFPQDHAHDFYVAKAVIGIAAVLLTIVYMDRTWEHLRSAAQMARNLVLLFGTVIAGAGSLEHLRHHTPVEVHNVGAAEFLLAVAAVMVYSIREDRRGPAEPGSRGPAAAHRAP